VGGGGAAGDEYSTEVIEGRRWEEGIGWIYKVKWCGYDERTWEPEINLTEGGVYNKHLLQFLRRERLIQTANDDNKRHAVNKTKFPTHKSASSRINGILPSGGGRISNKSETKRKV